MENRDFINEFIFQASRSGGAGGQNVNKVSTKVELRFHIDSSTLLNTEEKEILKQKLKNQITNEGFLQIVSQTQRTQLRNKENTITKFYFLLDKALKRNKIRKPSKPSQALKEKRLKDKKRDSEKKTMRNFNMHLE